MRLPFEQKIVSLLGKKPDNNTKFPYQPVPMTTALSRRQYEEQQFSAYGLQKERTFSLEILD